MKQKTETALKRLTCVALTLPGLIQNANAGRIDEDYKFDFQYGHYSESDKRMDVNIYEAALSIPIAKALTLSLSAVRDVISGASPMFNMINNKTGKPQQVLSGASIREQRDGLSGNIRYFLDDLSIGLGGGISSENDYLSRYVNTSIDWELNNKLTTLSFSASVAFDLIEPTGQNWSRDKTSQQYLIGVSQVLNKDSVLRSNMTFSYHQGYLSDPYKFVFFDKAGLRPDSRPSKKIQWAWLTQYVHHFKDLNRAALHADYRLYMDDWGIMAHTLEMSWHQPIADGWTIIPRLRYYTQGKADFYQPVFNSSHQKNIYSSDYRLADFGALSADLKITKEFKKLSVFEGVKFQAGIEYYDRRSAFQLGGNQSGSFDDFSYYLLTASINFKF